MDILNNAIDQAIAEKPNIVEDTRSLVERVTNQFINDKIKDFPRMCAVAGVMNAEKKKLLEEVGRKGKYTDSYGWTESGDMLADFDIPQELYTFMQTFVYREFWAEDNERIWRRFMNKICSGMCDYEYMNLFVKLKNYYGDTNLVRMTGHGAGSTTVS